MKRNTIIATSLSVLMLASTGIAQTVFTPGVLRYQLWSSTNPNGAQNPSRLDIENGLAGLPESDTVDLTGFDTPNSGTMDNYGDRISGLFIPPTTGKYVFFVNSDDDSDLFLNPNGPSPAGKQLVAQETAWSDAHQWLGGASTVTQKRSDKWKNSLGVQPWKDGIQLTAGQKYWIEAVHHEGGGGDNLSATFKLMSDPDPANGTPTAFTNNVIGYGYTIPASLTVLAQPSNTTAYAGSPVTFYFIIQNDLPDPLTYQWKRNGIDITNAVGPTYTLLATPADDAAVFSCVAKVNPTYGTLSATSASATLTVRPIGESVQVVGFLKAETYVGGTRTGVEYGNAGQPTMQKWSSLEGPVDQADGYARRVTGFFIPPTTGNYIFVVNSDDDSDLFLNPTGTDPAGKKLIAQETGWSGSRAWATGGNLIQKNSSTFVDPVDNTSPWAAGIALTAATPYYIEAVHHEGGGGDNLAATYYMVGGTAPADGDAPKLTGNVIAMITAPATKLTFTTQPVNTSVFDGQAGGFSVATAYDGELVPTYQWYKILGGTTNAIANATAASYKFTASTADNGAQYFAVASTVLNATSQVATLTVKQAVYEPGLLKYEPFFNRNATRAMVEAGTAGDPDFVTTYLDFAAPDHGTSQENFAARMSGLFTPKVTGKYVFYTCSDDDSDLFLSTDATPANKRLIAQEAGWSPARNWVGVGGGSTIEQKCSATWTDANGAQPWAAGIQLTAGNKYYIEAVMHDGTSGDNVGATFKLIDDPDPVNGEASKLTGDVIGFNAPAASYVAFEQQPQSVTVPAATTATFTAKATSDSTISIGGDPNQLVMYQWYKGTTAIAGATKPSYTTPLLAPSDSGTQYYVAARALGIAGWSNSAPATLTVNADTTPPTVTAAKSYSTTFIDGSSKKYVGVAFNELMDNASLAAGTYSIPGATIVSVEPNTNNNRSVRLEITGTPTGPVSVSGVKDFSGNPIASTSQAITAVTLNSKDIADQAQIPGDMALPTMLWVDGANEYTITAQGSDIWAASDGFNYMYEQKSGNFDVVVRQKSISHTSNWAKGGLMVRETLAAGSRNWNIVNTPLASDGIMAPDGSGYGTSAVECNTRTSTDVASNTGWDSNRGAISAYPNAWVRLARTNNTITAYLSSDGVNWTRAAQQDATTVGDATPLPSSLYVGICVSAHNNDTVGNLPYVYYNACQFADYNSNYVPVAAPPTMSLSKVGDVWQITFQGKLAASPTANGTYTDVSGATSPYTVNTSTGTQFFRAHW